MSKSNDATRQEVLGPKLYIETDNPESGAAGPEAFCIKGENASNKRVLLAHHDGGLTRFETEERFQVDVANKSTDSDTGMQLTCWKGKISVNADGDVVIHSNNSIVLSAEKNISLHANGIVEVGTSKGETAQVILQANQVNVSSGGGNLGKHLKQGPFSHVVDSVDSLIGGMVDGIRDSYGVG